MSRRIVVVSAGVSQPSSTRLLADQISSAVSSQISNRGEQAVVEVIELRVLASDLSTMITSGVATPALSAALQTVRRADALIAVTPVFSASYSGLFKLFFDVLEPGSLDDTPVLIAATAGTARHQLVLDLALRPLFSYLHAVVVPTGVFAATEDFGGGGGNDLTVRIQRAASELAGLVVSESGAVAGFTTPLDEQRLPKSVPVTPFAQLLKAGRVTS